MLTAILLASCAESKDESLGTRSASSPSAESSESGASDEGAEASPRGTAFVSYRYGYSITLPTGWDGNKALEDLKPGQIPGPQDESVDRYEPGPGCKEGQCGTDSAATVTLFVGAAPTEAGLDEYSRTFPKELAQRFPPCGKPTSRENSTVDGEPAVLMSWSCSDGYFVMNLLSIHAGMGFIIGWVGTEGTEKQQRETFEAALSTFAFD